MMYTTWCVSYKINVIYVDLFIYEINSKTLGGILCFPERSIRMKRILYSNGTEMCQCIIVPLCSVVAEVFTRVFKIVM